MAETSSNICPDTGEQCLVRAEVIRCKGIVDTFRDASVDPTTSDGRTSIDDIIMHANDALRAEVFSGRATSLLEATGDCGDVCVVAKAAVTFVLNPHAAPARADEYSQLQQATQPAAKG